MLHLYELASLLEGMVEYCMKGFIPYPISTRRRCLGQVKIWARKLAIEFPDSQAMVSTTKKQAPGGQQQQHATLYDLPINVNCYDIPTR